MLHAEVDGSFDGRDDVDIVVVSVFFLNMPGDYALPHDGVGDGNEAVGAEYGDHQQPCHNACGDGAIDETSPEVVAFERYINLLLH